MPTSFDETEWTQDPFQKPIQTTRGINELGNAYRRDDYSDGSHGFGYHNQDGTHYERNPDGSSEFDTGRGVVVLYPPPAPDEPVGPKEYGRREDVQQREPFNSTRVEEGRDRYHQSGPANCESAALSSSSDTAGFTSQREVESRTEVGNQAIDKD